MFFSLLFVYYYTSVGQLRIWKIRSQLNIIFLLGFNLNWIANELLFSMLQDDAFFHQPNHFYSSLTSTVVYNCFTLSWFFFAHRPNKISDIYGLFKRLQHSERSVKDLSKYIYILVQHRPPVCLSAYLPMVTRPSFAVTKISASNLLKTLVMGLD